METVGVVGLGRMGWALAVRLADQGKDVRGWTRSGTEPGKAAQAGFSACKILSELAAQCDVMVLSLFDEAAVRDVLGQLREMDLSGKLVVETSTVSPQVVRDQQADIEAAGGRLIDAPVSGGPEMVAAGTAGLFLGGEADDVLRFTPVAALFSNRAPHIGALGAGAAAKIVNNVALAGAFQAALDALDLGEGMGLGLPTMLGFLEDSPGITPMFKARIAKMLGEDDAVGFSISAVRKDMKVFLAAAKETGVEIPAVARFSEHVHAVASELDDEDPAALIRERFKQG